MEKQKRFSHSFIPFTVLVVSENVFWEWVVGVMLSCLLSFSLFRWCRGNEFWKWVVGVAPSASPALYRVNQSNASLFFLHSKKRITDAHGCRVWLIDKLETNEQTKNGYRIMCKKRSGRPGRA